MAQYSLNLGVLGRHTGRSFHAALAYNTGSLLKRTEASKDADTGIVILDVLPKSYIHKAGVISNTTYAPAWAPAWVYDAQILADRVQAAEKRKDAREGRTIIIALQKEFSVKENQALLEGFIKENIVSLGLIANVAIHYDDDNNPHAHILFTTRRIEKDGFEAKKEEVGKIINSESFLGNIRKDWEKRLNKKFLAKGLDIRVSCESYEKQGIEVIATKHDGYVARKMQNLGLESDRIDLNKEIYEKNYKTYIENSDVFIKYITATYTKFTMDRVVASAYEFVTKLYDYGLLNESQNDFYKFSDNFITHIKNSKLLKIISKDIDGTTWYFKDMIPGYDPVTNRFSKLEENSNASETTESNQSDNLNSEDKMKKYNNIFGLYGEFFEHHNLMDNILKNPDALIPEFGFRSAPKKNALYNSISYSLVDGSSRDYEQKVSLVWDEGKKCFFINDIPNQNLKDSNGKAIGTMNLISYLQKRDNISLDQTLNKICESYGIQFNKTILDKYKEKDWVPSTASLVQEKINFVNVPGDGIKEKIDNLVHNFLVHGFRSGAQNEELKSFLRTSRKMKDDNISNAINNWKDAGWLGNKRDLNKYLENAGVTKDLLKQYYNAIGSDISKKTYIDFPLFDTHQLTFTIRDPEGKVIGFVQRQTKEGYTDKNGNFVQVKGKYKVSSGTERGATLFGLNYVSKNRDMVYVEGYIDCTNPNSFSNKKYDYVASGGVDFNELKAKLIANKEPNSITIFLDNDVVGQKNIAKTLDLLMKQNLKNIRIARPLENFKDADEMLNSAGILALEDHIKRSYSVSEYFYNLFENSYEKSSDLEKHVNMKDHIDILEQYNTESLGDYLGKIYAYSKAKGDIGLGLAVSKTASEKLPKDLFDKVGTSIFMDVNVDGSILGLESIRDERAELVISFDENNAAMNFYGNRKFDYVSVKAIDKEISQQIAQKSPFIVVLDIHNKTDNQIRKYTKTLRDSGIENIFINNIGLKQAKNHEEFVIIENEITSNSGFLSDYLKDIFVSLFDNDIKDVAVRGLNELNNMVKFKIQDQMQRDLELLDGHKWKDEYVNGISKYLSLNGQDALVSELHQMVGKLAQNKQINQEIINTIDNIEYNAVGHEGDQKTFDVKENHASPKDVDLVVEDITQNIISGLGVFDRMDFERILSNVASNVGKEFKKEIADRIREDSYAIIEKSADRAGLYIHKNSISQYTNDELIEQIRPKVNEKSLYRISSRLNEIRNDLKQQNIQNIMSNEGLRSDDIISVVANSVAKSLAEDYIIFSANDIMIRIDKEVNIDSVNVELREAVFSNIMKQGLVKELGRKDLNGNLLYSTPKYLKLEEEAIANINSLNNRKSFNLNISNEKIEKIIENNKEKLTLNESQKEGVRYLFENKDIAHIEGIAGSGKSTLLKVFKEIIDTHSNKKLLGAAISGPVAQNLGLDLGLDKDAMTIASLLKSIHEGKRELDSDTILIIDEAGQVGTDHMKQLTDIVLKAGAKLILVGATNQAQPIKSAQIFDIIGNIVGSHKLDIVIRQNQDWQKEATVDFDNNSFEAGLTKYMEHRHIHIANDLEAAVNNLALDYVTKILEGKEDIKNSIVLSYTNNDASKLNIMIRNWLVEAGYLKDQKNFKLKMGYGNDKEVKTLPLAVNEKIMFLSNDYRNYDVRNGTLGTITKIDGDDLKIRLDKENREFWVDLKTYNFINHAYAATADKWQGSTEKNVYALLTSSMNSTNAYPMLTRHKENLQIYCGRSDFEKDENKDLTVRTIADKIGKDRFRSNAYNYSLDEEALSLNDRAFNAVKEYKKLNDEINGILIDLSNEYMYHIRETSGGGDLAGKIDERAELATDILIDYDLSRRYLQEAGLSNKSILEEYVGLRTRHLRDYETEEQTILNDYLNSEGDDKIKAADSLVRKRVPGIAFYMESFDQKLQESLMEDASKAHELSGYVGRFAKLEQEGVFFGLADVTDKKSRKDAIKLYEDIKKDYERLENVTEYKSRQDLKIQQAEIRKNEIEKEIYILEKFGKEKEDFIEAKKESLKTQEGKINSIKDKNYKKWEKEIPELERKLGRFVHKFDFMQFSVIMQSVEQLDHLHKSFEKNFDETERLKIMNQVYGMKNLLNNTLKKQKNEDEKDATKAQMSESIEARYPDYILLKEREKKSAFLKKEIAILSKGNLVDKEILDKKIPELKEELDKVLYQIDSMDKKKLIKEMYESYMLGRDVLETNAQENFKMVTSVNLKQVGELDFKYLAAIKKAMDIKAEQRLARLSVGAYHLNPKKPISENVIVNETEEPKPSKNIEIEKAMLLRESTKQKITETQIEPNKPKDYSNLEEYIEYMKATDVTEKSKTSLSSSIKKNCVNNKAMEELIESLGSKNESSIKQKLGNLDIIKDNIISKTLGIGKIEERKSNLYVGFKEYFGLIEKEHKALGKLNDIKFYNESSFEKLKGKITKDCTYITAYDVLVGSMIIDKDRTNHLLTAQNIKKYSKRIGLFSEITDMRKDHLTVIEQAVQYMADFSLDSEKLNQFFDQKHIEKHLQNMGHNKNTELLTNAVKMVMAASNKDLKDIDINDLTHKISASQNNKAYEKIVSIIKNKELREQYHGFAIAADAALNYSFEKTHGKQNPQMISHAVESALSKASEFEYHSSNSSENTRDNGWSR